MDWATAAERATATDGGSGYWQLALVLGAIGFLGLFARWRKLRTPIPPTVTELRERDEDPNRYRDAADRAIVELLETSRSLNAQVDTKIRMLNRLVKEADEQCARLEGLLARARSTSLEDETVQFIPEEEPLRPEPRISSRLSVAESGGGGEPGQRFLSDLHERIYHLRQAGKTVPEIAKATNLSTTEVEFIVQTF